MAIASCAVQVISRSSGRSSVAAAAYRSGETLQNEREGKTYSYARKTDRVYNEILAPSHAPEWARIRGQLWNQVERQEKRKDSQLAREVMIALPKELERSQNIALARAYAQTFANDGMVADLSIHDKGDGNPHAHIMLTTRPFLEDGTWGAKSKEALLLDAEGQPIRLKNGNYKSRKIPTTDWNTPEKLLEWRQRYEHFTNDHLEKAGFKERITVASYEAQGIDKIPTVHMGHFVHELERAGIKTKVGTINRQIQAENQQREALKQQLDATRSAIEQEQKKQEAMRKKAKPSGTDVSAHPEGSPVRTIGYEEMYKIYESSKKEALKKLQEEATQRDRTRYERKFVRGGKRLQRPARFGPRHRHRMKHPNWTKFAEGLRAKQQRLYKAPQPVDWAHMAKEQEEKRVDWKELAEEENRRFEDLYKQPHQRRQGPEHDRDR